MTSDLRIEGFGEVEHHVSLGSTSDRLRERAREGAAPFTAVLADEQTAGRGRGGRGWHSASRSGLWISVLLPPPPGGPPGAASLAVGAAAARAIEGVTGVEVGLKWPNDLLVRGAPERPVLGKVGGILCEAVRAPDGALLVAGVGINLRRAPDAPEEAVRAAAFLDEATGRRIEAEELAAALAAELRRLADPPPDVLEGELREEWDRRDLLRGRIVRTEMAPRGIAVGLARDGTLQVSDPAGRVHAVRAGTVRLEGEGPAALFSSG